MIKAIVFDFDGVLVDSEPLHYRAFLETAQGAGIDVDFDYAEYLEKYVGFDDRDGFAAMLEAVNVPVGAGGSRTSIMELCRSKQEAFNAIVAEGVATTPGVMAMIESLPAHVPAAIASGATRTDIDLILKSIGLTGRFDPIVSASDVARSKPDPQTYRMACEQLAARHPQIKLSPADCLAIEDTVAGIASARGAGLWTLGVATTTAAANLHSAHRVVDNLEGVTFEKLVEWFG